MGINFNPVCVYIQRRLNILHLLKDMIYLFLYKLYMALKHFPHILLSKFVSHESSHQTVSNAF